MSEWLARVNLMLASGYLNTKLISFEEIIQHFL
jgi:hypothetical protein